MMTSPRLVPDAPTEQSWAVLRIGSLLPYLALVLSASLVFIESVDDPFITFRYAYNLVHGNGPVFNVGERVEGFTSPLHLIVCAAILQILPSVGMLFKAKLASLLFGGGAVFLTGRFARQVGLSTPQSIAAQTLLALSFNFAVASVNGLETTMYACLILVAASTYLRETQTKRGYASGGWLFVAWLARPEAILIFAFLLAFRLVRAYRDGLRKNALCWSALFILPALAVVALRMGYFGLPLPNTYYAKTVSLHDSLRDGALYLSKGFAPYPLQFSRAIHGHIKDLFFVVIAIPFWVLAFWGFRKLDLKDAVAIMACIACATFLFVLRSGGDWMLGWRFLISIMPFLSVTQVRGLAALGSRLGPSGSKALFGAVLAVWLVSLALSPFRPGGVTDYRLKDRDFLERNGDHGSQWVLVGDFMSRTCPRGSLIAYSEMGYASWVNLDKSFVDTRGLTNSEIARFPSSYKNSTGVTDEQWYQEDSPLGRVLLRRLPDYIFTFDGSVVSEKGEARFKQALGRYDLAQVLSAKPESGIFTAVFVRRP